MSEEIIQLLVAHRDRLDRAIEALQGSTKPVDVYDDPTMPEWVKPKANIAPSPKKKGMSAATRRKMAEGQKRRWAAIKAAKAQAVTPKISKLAAIIAPPEDTEFKSKMSIAMAKSWANRQKAAAKKKASNEK